MRNLRALLTATLALSCIAWPCGASAQSRCLGQKLEAMGRKEAGLLACLAGVAAKGGAAGFPKCNAKVTSRFARGYTTAGLCGEERTRCECLTEMCAIDVRLALPDAGPSRCEAARLRAAGKHALRKVRCSVEAVKAGTPVDPACVQRAEAKFLAAFARTRGCSGGAAAVADILDAECVTALGADPTGGGTVDELCTSHACDTVD